jgi:hypothetical protein
VKGHHFLYDLPRLSQGRTRRSSSWDRSGGNRDNVWIDPGETKPIADIEGCGSITHIWITIAHADIFWARSVVLRAFFDGSDSPCIEAPLGDFFGVGNCRPAPYWSAAFSTAPVGGRGLNCFVPMPYGAGARLEIENQSELPAPAVYYYVDYEEYPGVDASALSELGRFHAWWNREAPTSAVDHSGEPSSFGFRGVNLDGSENYVVLEAEGRGHYIGCHLYIYNEAGGWWGEGDDMIFVDGEEFPPSLHGTGTEDYFGTAWSPSETFISPYHGISFAERSDWRGFSSWYRFHIADPIRFEKSIKVTIEHGHANDRSDDWSSVGYWYQPEPHAPQRRLPPVEDRIPPASPQGEEALMRASQLVRTIFEDIQKENRGSTSQLTQFARLSLVCREIEQRMVTSDWTGMLDFVDRITR